MPFDESWFTEASDFEFDSSMDFDFWESPKPIEKKKKAFVKPRVAEPKPTKFDAGKKMSHKRKKSRSSGKINQNYLKTKFGPRMKRASKSKGPLMFSHGVKASKQLGPKESGAKHWNSASSPKPNVKVQRNALKSSLVTKPGVKTPLGRISAFQPKTIGKTRTSPLRDEVFSTSSPSLKPLKPEFNFSTSLNDYYQGKFYTIEKSKLNPSSLSSHHKFKKSTKLSQFQQHQATSVLSSKQMANQQLMRVEIMKTAFQQENSSLFSATQLKKDGNKSLAHIGSSAAVGGFTRRETFTIDDSEERRDSKTTLLTPTIIDPLDWPANPSVALSYSSHLPIIPALNLDPRRPVTETPKIKQKFEKSSNSTAKLDDAHRDHTEEIPRKSITRSMSKILTESKMAKPSRVSRSSKSHEQESKEPDMKTGGKLTSKVLPMSTGRASLFPIPEQATPALTRTRIDSLELTRIRITGNSAFDLPSTSGSETPRGFPSRIQKPTSQKSHSNAAPLPTSGCALPVMKVSPRVASLISNSTQSLSRFPKTPSPLVTSASRPMPKTNSIFPSTGVNHTSKQSITTPTRSIVATPTQSIATPDHSIATPDHSIATPNKVNAIPNYLKHTISSHSRSRSRLRLSRSSRSSRPASPRNSFLSLAGRTRLNSPNKFKKGRNVKKIGPSNSGHLKLRMTQPQSPSFVLKNRQRVWDAK